MINDFGYLDEKGRQALKISVSTLPNRQDLRLLVDDKNERIILAADHVQVAYGSFSQIEKRLNEKLNNTVFIGAVASGSGRNEKFSYKTLTFCGNPSAKAFSQLVKERVITLELRMHLEPNGKLRDHGYQFRIKSSRLISLFSKHIQFR